MAQEVNVANWPSDGSKERVAYDLMVDIISAETRGKAYPDKRAFFFELYGQCLRIVSGEPPS